jgi:hypothetical protein
MQRSLTVEEARQAFLAVAALGDEIAFRWLLEGCECRAQLMIEHLQGQGLIPGRAWAISVSRWLTVAHPEHPGEFYKWNSHVAPTLAVERVEHGLLVIDPSLSPTGPLTVTAWAETMRARSIEVSRTGLAEAEILNLQGSRTLEGKTLDAVVFLLAVGEPPVRNRGGTGLLIGPDPPEGIGAYARRMMAGYLAKQNRQRPGPV